MALGSTPVTAAAQHAAATAAPAKNTSATSTKAQKHVRHKKKPVEVAQPEAPPPPPPTPEQSPAGPPEVRYQQGELSIRSDNSTLSSILDAVKNNLGATVDAPGSASSDRIATQIGPGDPRKVLTTLLNNSKYDFILLGNPGNPQSVQKIILTARATGGATPAAAAPQPASRGYQPPQPDQDQEVPDAEIPDDASQPEQPPQPEPQPEPTPPPPQGLPQPGMGQPGVQPEAGDQQNPNQPKTPEQLLQELQRMQQQQQQQQQNPQ